MSRCYTMNTDLINKTQNITIQLLFNQVITMSRGSMRSNPLQWIPSDEVKILAIWGTEEPLVPAKHSWGQTKKTTERFRLLGPPAKWSLFMDQQIHQHLILSSEQKSEQLFLTCNINNLIYFSPLLSWRCVLHSLVRVCGEMWDRTLNKPIFCTIDPTIVLFLCLCPPPGSPLSYENVIGGSMVLNY